MGLMGDTRGQSTVVGVTLVFALIIIGLGTTQAFVVPQQNAAVAQNHWENAQDDMSQLRSVMDRIADRESSASVAVKLGQRLPDRPFLVEGTPPSGTLETRPVSITIRGKNYTAPVDEEGNNNGIIDPEDLNGSLGGPTKELRYTQSGGDWQTITSFIGPVSTFVKQDGQVSQSVVESGNRIDVLILKGNVSVGGVRTEEVDLTGIDRSCTAIEGTDDTEIEVKRSGTPDREINWSDGEIRQVCLLVISINDDEVTDAPRVSPEPEAGDTNNNTLFNPTFPLQFKCADERGNKDVNNTIVDMTFKNTAGNALDIDSSRVAVYQDGESSNDPKIPDTAELIDPTGTVVATLDVAGESEDLSLPIGFSPGESRTVAFNFTFGGNTPNTRNDVMVIRFTLSNGTVTRYYIQVQQAGDCNHAGTGSTGGSTSIDSVSITDNSENTGSQKAEFDVTADISNPPNSGTVEATFTNLDASDSGSDSKSTSSGTATYSLQYSGSPNTFDDTYEIEIKVFDSSDTLLESTTTTEVADGS